MRRHNRDDLLASACAVALRDGLNALTFGAVAREADVPDRTVVYYFASKAVLLGAVIEALAVALLSSLDEAIGPRRQRPRKLLLALWPAVTAEEVRPVVRVWLELCARAATREGAEREAAQKLAHGFLAFLETRMDADDRPAAAATVLARLDGALLLHEIGLPEAASRAVGLP